MKGQKELVAVPALLLPPLLLLLLTQMPTSLLVHPPPLPLQAIPAVLEIPSKDSPYDPNQDSLLQRVKHLLGMS